jgi:hypothetical protein
MRDEIYVAEVIGADGPGVVTDIEDAEKSFGEASLADFVQKSGIDLNATAQPRPIALAGGQPLYEWNGSLFGYTSFMTSTWLGFAPQAIQSLAGNATFQSQTINRSETHDSTIGSLKEHLVLTETVTVGAGQGRIVFDVALTSTADMTDAATGNAVAHRTSNDTGHFEVNSCPDAQGNADGKYSLVDKEEVTNVGGASNAASASTDATFSLLVGDDAHLVETKVDANVDSRAHGTKPGTTGGAREPFDWSATGTFDLTIPSAGSTNYDAKNIVTSDGTNAKVGHLSSLVVVADHYLAEAARQAEKFWRSGDCIELKTSDESRAVQPNEQVSLIVDSTHKWDRQPVTAPIKASFSGKTSLNPTDTEQPPPASFTFTAGTTQGDKGTIDLTQTGKRGIGKKTVKFTVAGSSVGFAGTYQTPYGNPKILAPVGAVSCTADLSGPWAVLSFGNPDFTFTTNNIVAKMNDPATSKYVELVHPGETFTLYGESQFQGVLTPSTGPPSTVRLDVSQPGGGGYTYNQTYQLTPMDPAAKPAACPS